ncbi:hypothetical protein RchiOBHm_Chr6g0303401 [Rosa chinensis]|uniref:Uncharacterized protein n=1 Tax=Rosa chinensis TaxID=74649 RepID=A0A2P6PZC2_ROSCH|nr:hypothetical protein RchiOBHm_Chr6g0303401 [Rosa chinensis]
MTFFMGVLVYLHFLLPYLLVNDSKAANRIKPFKKLGATNVGTSTKNGDGAKPGAHKPQAMEVLMLAAANL